MVLWICVLKKAFYYPRPRKTHQHKPTPTQTSQPTNASTVSACSTPVVPALLRWSTWASRPEDWQPNQPSERLSLEPFVGMGWKNPQEHHFLMIIVCLFVCLFVWGIWVKHHPQQETAWLAFFIFCFCGMYELRCGFSQNRLLGTPFILLHMYDVGAIFQKTPRNQNPNKIRAEYQRSTADLSNQTKWFSKLSTHPGSVCFVCRLKIPNTPRRYTPIPQCKWNRHLIGFQQGTLCLL